MDRTLTVMIAFLAPSLFGTGTVVFLESVVKYPIRSWSFIIYTKLLLASQALRTNTRLRGFVHMIRSTVEEYACRRVVELATPWAPLLFDMDRWVVDNVTVITSGQHIEAWFPNTPSALSSFISIVLHVRVLIIIFMHVISYVYWVAEARADEDRAENKLVSVAEALYQDRLRDTDPNGRRARELIREATLEAAKGEWYADWQGRAGACGFLHEWLQTVLYIVERYADLLLAPQTPKVAKVFREGAQGLVLCVVMGLVEQ